MSKIYEEYKDVLKLCKGAHENYDVSGWTTVHYFDDAVKSKQFNAKVYKQGKRVVIAFAGTYKKDISDWQSDVATICKIIPPQLKDAEELYNSVKELYEKNNINVDIEFMGYSLGATIANLMSHKTGLPSHAIAPIGSKHIAETYKKIFKYDDSNITTYGRKSDAFFNFMLRRNTQSGKIYILPDLTRERMDSSKEGYENHLLHHFTYEEFKNVKIYNKKFTITDYSEEFMKTLKKDFEKMLNELNQEKHSNVENLKFPVKKVDISELAGWKNPIDGDNKIYTKEDIDSMSEKELKKVTEKLYWQATKIGIPTVKQMKESQYEHGGVVHVRAYVKADGTHVRDYWRSVG